MRRSTKLMGSSALAAMTLAAPLRADVAPIEVWQNLEAFMQDVGYTVTSDLDMSQVGSGALNVRNIVMRIDLPEDAGSLAFDIDELRLLQRDDGEVLALFPDVMPIRFSTTDSGDEEVDMVIAVTTEMLEMYIAAEGDTTTVRTIAPDLRIALDELVVDGETVPRQEARASLTLMSVTGETSVVTAGMRQIDQTIGVGEARYDIAFNDPDSDESGAFSGTMEQVLYESDTTLPAAYDPQAMADMATLIESGLEGDGAITYVNGRTEFSATEDSGVTSGRLSTDTARFGVSIGPDGLAYGFGNTGLQVDVTSPDMPFPVAAAMAETAFDIKVPVLVSESPQEVALGVTLGGFTMSELLWSIFDPGAALPRDPATVSFDVLGQVTPFLSLFDTDAMEALEGGDEMPGELNAVTLRNLVVEAAGARLTGMGDFTFDNTDLETFDGLPRPEGAVDLRLSGANALIDTLIAMGVVSDEDAMGARMMMSMFAVPDGDDQLMSTIEVNAQGHVLANGQRIR